MRHVFLQGSIYIFFQLVLHAFFSVSLQPTIPRCSIYRICTYIWAIFGVNVSKYFSNMEHLGSDIWKNNPDVKRSSCSHRNPNHFTDPARWCLKVMSELVDKPYVNTIDKKQKKIMSVNWSFKYLVLLYKYTPTVFLNL